MSAELPSLIRALLDPRAYDHAAANIELIQTHISYVLLAGEFAYKIKKPVDLKFLDYSTLEKRKHMCEEEVRLNRRLCVEVYLSVVGVAAAGDGYRIATDGDPVEYAVKMRRVPARLMMPARLERDEIAPDHVRAIARKMAGFHLASEADDRIADFGRPAAIRLNWEENFAQAAPYVGRTLTASQHEALRGYVERFLREQAELLKARADQGCVRDCHGDLRADAIVIDDDGEICIMDCIEFNDRIRFGDVAGDIAFLAMDLEYRGRGDLADELVAAYLGVTNDEMLPLVLDFYRCYRAYIRGKVESLLLDEPEVTAYAKADAIRRARRYFALALGYATTAHPPVLVMMVGLSGTGKSHVAGALAARTGAALLRSDVVRKQLLGVATDDPMRADPGGGIYSGAARADVYGAMHQRAADHLARGRSAILDATYINRSNRDAARAVADAAGVPLLAVEVTADELLVRAQLAQRDAEPGGASDAGWRVYLDQQRQFEVPDEIPAGRKVRIDTSRTLESNVNAVVAALERPSD